MSGKQNYNEAVMAIKTAILQSQYDAERTVMMNFKIEKICN